MSNLHIVFTYGTLQTGERNFEKYMSGAESLGRTRTLEPGFLMGHHASATSPGKRTPGAVSIGLHGSYIEGEAFRVTDEQLEALDILEGITGKENETYFRAEIALENEDKAWVYLMKREETFQPSAYITYDREQNSYSWKEVPTP